MLFSPVDGVPVTDRSIPGAWITVRTMGSFPTDTANITKGIFELGPSAFGFAPESKNYFKYSGLSR